MKFNSQICTTKIQSERLLALGLKKETADMAHLAFDEYSGLAIRPYVWQPTTGVDMENFIPAWSLHRLIEIAQLPQSWQCLSGNWYNEIIAHIQSMIHINQFNKEYLKK